MNEFDVERDGAEARVAMGEKLTATVAPALQAALKDAINTGAREIILDMNATLAIDSTGIGLLIATNNSLTAVQGKIRVINASDDILGLFRSMRLIERLNASAAPRQ